MCIDGRCGTFTPPEDEDLDALLAGFKSTDDGIPDGLVALGLILGQLLGADSVTIMKVPKGSKAHPGRNHPAFAG